MKVTVHLEISETQWGHILDRAEGLGWAVEDYIATAATYSRNFYDFQEANQ